jgi:polyhydroxybutyrate depolymerase
MRTLLLAAAALMFGFASTAEAGIASHLFDRFRAKSKSETANDKLITYGDRDMYVFVPSHLQPAGKRALVVVLHGGGGNAQRIVSQASESALNMDKVAERDGFIVAYLNGTKVALMLGSDKKGWNAGNCCGVSSSDNVDDVGYISGAVKYLTDQYAIDPRSVFAIGHSNGAMMAMRMVCETDVFAAIIPISGTLGITGECAHAGDKYVYAIHGQDDDNVPYNGGVGKGPSKTDFMSQDYTRQVFIHAGAQYVLQEVPGAGHKLETIANALQKTERNTIPEKAAAFFAQHPLKR